MFLEWIHLFILVEGVLHFTKKLTARFCGRTFWVHLCLCISVLVIRFATSPHSLWPFSLQYVLELPFYFGQRETSAGKQRAGRERGWVYWIPSPTGLTSNWIPFTPIGPCPHPILVLPLAAFSLVPVLQPEFQGSGAPGSSNTPGPLPCPSG